MASDAVRQRYSLGTGKGLTKAPSGKASTPQAYAKGGKVRLSRGGPIGVDPSGGGMGTTTSNSSYFQGTNMNGAPVTKRDVMGVKSFKGFGPGTGGVGKGTRPTITHKPAPGFSRQTIPGSGVPTTTVTQQPKLRAKGFPLHGTRGFKA